MVLHVFMYTHIHSYICLFIHLLISIQYRSCHILPETRAGFNQRSLCNPGRFLEKSIGWVLLLQPHSAQCRSCSCHASTAPLSNSSNRSPIKSGSSFSSIVSTLGWRTPVPNLGWVVQSLRYFNYKWKITSQPPKDDNFLLTIKDWPWQGLNFRGNTQNFYVFLNGTVSPVLLCDYVSAISTSSKGPAIVLHQN